MDREVGPRGGDEERLRREESKRLIASARRILETPRGHPQGGLRSPRCAVVSILSRLKADAELEEHSDIAGILGQRDAW
jgi:hypothetical protein